MSVKKQPEQRPKEDEAEYETSKQQDSNMLNMTVILTIIHIAVFVFVTTATRNLEQATIATAHKNEFAATTAALMNASVALAQQHYQLARAARLANAVASSSGVVYPYHPDANNFPQYMCVNITVELLMDTPTSLLSIYSGDVDDADFEEFLQRLDLMLYGGAEIIGGNNNNSESQSFFSSSSFQLFTCPVDDAPGGSRSRGFYFLGHEILDPLDDLHGSTRTYIIRTMMMADQVGATNHN